MFFFDASHQVGIGIDLAAAQRKALVGMRPVERWNIQKGFDLLCQLGQYRFEVDRQQPEYFKAGAADVLY